MRHAMHLRTAASTLLIFVLAIAFTIIPTQYAHAAIGCSATICTIYMAPGTEDNAETGTAADPVHSLARAHTLLVANRTQVQGHDVRIEIGQGEYIGGTTDWTFYIPNHKIRFLPAGYDPNGTAIPQRPIFIGDEDTADSIPGPDSWVSILSGSSGASTNLEFYYLQVRNYSRYGIYINGGTQVVSGQRKPNGIGINNNRFEGMLINEIGTPNNAGGCAYGAIVATNSNNNTIVNNVFTQLKNESPCVGNVHGVYLLHGSDNNEVIDNYFSNISGNPVDVRNESLNNIINDNIFNRTGHSTSQPGHYFEWFDAIIESDGYECESYNNVFKFNTLGTTFNDGTIQLPEKHVLDQPDPDNERSGCTWTTQPRVLVDGNHY